MDYSVHVRILLVVARVSLVVARFGVRFRRDVSDIPVRLHGSIASVITSKAAHDYYN